MSTEKMRDEFEAWALEGWAEESLSRFSNGDYCGHTLNFCWMAWQASRASIEIELPGEAKGWSPDECSEADGFNDGVDRCRSAIERLGLKVKS